MDIINEVKQHLLRKDGRINSAKLKSKSVTWLINVVINHTNYLDINASFTRRWWHILNTQHIPNCIGCDNCVGWNIHQQKYNKFCSQQCAVTSVEARNRAHNTHIGRLHTIEQKTTQSIRMMGHQHSEQTIKKLSIKKIGELNPRFGKSPWNNGLTGNTHPSYGVKRPGTGLKGPSNPQFGKSPSVRAGKGIWGKFNHVHFRSSLELMYLVYWYEHNITIKSAETSEYRVLYTSEQQTIRTYSPDFYLPETNELVEIKPEKLHTNTQVLLKLSALRLKHSDKVCKIIGFKQISNFIQHKIENNNIDDYLTNGLLVMNEIQITRLRKNYADIIRATR
jgi:hypothetical protein